MARRKRTPEAVKFKHYTRARYIGDDDSVFQPLKVYRGDFYVFPKAVILRHISTIYQSGRGNWEDFK